MKQEDKDLLLKDLCGRLPYGVVIQEKCIEHDEMFLPSAEDNKLVNIDVHEELVITNGGSRYYIEDVKPYLFPMTSMTEEQKKEYAHILVMCSNLAYSQLLGMTVEDWLNKNHFDYRGLILKDLLLIVLI